jgi:glycosyltransferase involved in cell wall biosynthesis
MKIGFDAKRAFRNRSGLGNYSRSIISLLNEYYPDNEYILYTTDDSKELFKPSLPNKIVTPQHILSKNFPSAWRTFCLNSAIDKERPDIFHGLSNELPYGISKSKTRSIVTIHDLIFLRYPGFYPWLDRQIYKSKFRHACETADRVIAVSEATRQDIIEFYGIKPEKVTVAYQTCNPIFQRKVSENERNAIRVKYDLPDTFILTVGSIEERKNVLTILKALNTSGIEVPLVIVGKPTAYLQEIKAYILKFKMEKQVHVLHNVSTTELPGLYQSASLFVYPSLFEGFGIPILEALFAGTPVITSKGGCFEETGGNAALYTDPVNIDEMADLIGQVMADTELRKTMITNGFKHADQFTGEQVVKRIMQIYQGLIS